MNKVTITIGRNNRVLTEVELTLREHGKYKPLHWLTIGIWLQLARLLPSFNRTYKDGLNTVATDGTIYYVPGYPPSDRTLLHEAFHVWQWRRDGVWGLLKRLLVMYNMYAEAEAYAFDGTPLAVCVDKLMGGAYFRPPWWSRRFVFAVAAVAYAEQEEL